MRRNITDTISGRAEHAVYEDLEGRNITFDSCVIPRRASKDGPTLLRNVVLQNARHINCDIHTAALQDVLLHDMKREGSAPLFLWGCVFKHVQIKGRVAGLKINRSISPVPGVPDEERAAWDQLTIEFYRSVDWALDIADAQFSGGVSFEAIPGDKVRINRETQALVRRSALQGNDWWRTYDFGVTPMKVEIKSFLERSLFESVIVAARTESKYAKQDIAAINALRLSGLAE